jgi:hypothetical protein
MSVNRLNELNRHRTKRGPGRMPYTRTAKPAGTKLAKKWRHG